MSFRSWLDGVKLQIDKRREEFAKQEGLDQRFWDAVSHGETDTAQQLLGAGANVDYVYDCRDGDTPLRSVCMRGPDHLVSFLVDHGADINSTGHGGVTALMHAAFNGRAKSVEYLLAHGANVNAEGKDGITALSCAREGRNPQTRNLIIAKLKAAGAVDTNADKKTIAFLQAEQVPSPHHEELAAALRDATALDWEAKDVAWRLCNDPSWTDGQFPVEITKQAGLPFLIDACRSAGIHVEIAEPKVDD